MGALPLPPLAGPLRLPWYLRLPWCINSAQRRAGKSGVAEADWRWRRRQQWRRWVRPLREQAAGELPLRQDGSGQWQRTTVAVAACQAGSACWRHAAPKSPAVYGCCQVACLRVLHKPRPHVGHGGARGVQVHHCRQSCGRACLGRSDEQERHRALAMRLQRLSRRVCAEGELLLHQSAAPRVEISTVSWGDCRNVSPGPASRNICQQSVSGAHFSHGRHSPPGAAPGSVPLRNSQKHEHQPAQAPS